MSTSQLVQQLKKEKISCTFSICDTTNRYTLDYSVKAKKVFTNVYLNMGELQADFLSCSAHSVNLILNITLVHF